MDENLSINLAAKPVHGQANLELVNYLSKVFGVRKSNVVIEQVLQSEPLKHIFTLNSFCTFIIFLGSQIAE